MGNVLHVPVPNGGQAANCWGARGAPGITSLLFINQDLNNTVWLGQDSTLTSAGPNSIPIAPNGTFSGAVDSAWYVVGSVAGIQPLVVVPNGSAYFLGLTAGMGSLVIPSVQSPNFISGVSGWQIRKDGSAEFNNITIRGGETIGGITLAYNGTPAHGNLVYSESVNPGTDQFGNAFQAGVWVYGSAASIGMEAQGPIGTLILVPNGLTHASNTPPSIFANGINIGMANEIQELIAFSGQEIIGGNSAFQLFSESADGTIPAQGKLVITGAPILTWTAGGLAVNGNGQFTSNVSASFYLMPTISAPGPVSGNGEIFASLNGTPSAVMPSGLVGSMPLVQVDISSHSVGNTLTPGDITTAWTVPGNDGVQGTTYRIECLAGLVMGATATESLTIGVDINGTKTPLATLGQTFNGSAVSKAYDIPLQMYLTVDEIGTNTPKVYLNGPLGDTTDNRLATDSANMSGHSNGTTWNKGSANTLAVYAQWGGTGGAAQTVGTTSSRLYREGP